MAQLKRTLSTLAVAVALLALLSSMASAEWLYQFGNPQNNNQIPAGTSLNFTNSSDFYITATIDATSVVQASSANNNQVFEYLEGPYIDDSNNKCYALINFKNADTNNGYIPWAHAVLKTDLINYSKEISAKVVANAGEINSSVFNHTNSFYLGGKIDKPILLANTSSPVHEEENCMRVTVLAYQSGEAYFSKILELERNDGIPFKNNQGVNILWPYKYWEVFSSNPDVTPDDSSTYITASPHLQSMAPCFDSAGGVNYMYSYVNSSEVVDTLAGTFHVFPRTFKYSRSFSSNKWQWINAPFINSTSLIELLSFLNTPNYAPSDIDNYNLYKFNEPYLRYDPKYRTMLISGQGKSFLVTAVRQLDDTNVSDRVYISTLPGGIPTSNVHIDSFGTGKVTFNDFTAGTDADGKLIVFIATDKGLGIVQATDTSYAIKNNSTGSNISKVFTHKRDGQLDVYAFSASDKKLYILKNFTYANWPAPIIVTIPCDDLQGVAFGNQTIAYISSTANTGSTSHNYIRILHIRPTLESTIQVESPFKINQTIYDKAIASPTDQTTDTGVSYVNTASFNILLNPKASNASEKALIKSYHVYLSSVKDSLQDSFYITAESTGTVALNCSYNSTSKQLKISNTATGAKTYTVINPPVLKFSCKAVDETGKEGPLSSVLPVYIDLTLPGPPRLINIWTIAGQYSYGDGGNKGTVSSSPFTLSFTDVSNEADLPPSKGAWTISSYEAVKDGVKYLPAFNSTYHNLSSQTPGDFNFYTIDTAGHKSSPFLYTVSLDNQAPTVPGTPEAIPSGKAYYKDIVQLQWRESQDNLASLFDSNYITYRVNVTKVVGSGYSTIASISTSETTASIPLSAGEYYFTVRAVDGVNNTSASSPWSKKITVTGPLTSGPTNVIFAGDPSENPSTFTSLNELSLQKQLSTGYTLPPRISTDAFYFSRGKALIKWQAPATAPLGGIAKYNITGASSATTTETRYLLSYSKGIRSYSVEAVSQCGETGQPVPNFAPIAFDSSSSDISFVGSAIYFSAPRANWPLKTNSIDITWEASESTSGIYSSYLIYYPVGHSNQAATVETYWNNGVSTTYKSKPTVTLSSLSDGNYVFYAGIIDRAGNTSTTNKLFQKIVDAHAPTVLSFEVVSSFANPVFHIKITDEVSQVKTLTMEVIKNEEVQNSANIITSPTYLYDNNYTWNTSNLAAGEYSARILFTDGQGNPGSAVLSFTISNGLSMNMSIAENTSGSGKFYNSASIVDWNYKYNGGDLPSGDSITSLIAYIDNGTSNAIARDLASFITGASPTTSLSMESVSPNLSSGKHGVSFSAKDTLNNSAVATIGFIEYDRVAPLIDNSNGKTPTITVGSTISSSRKRLVTFEAGLTDDYSGVYDVTIDLSAQIYKTKDAQGLPVYETTTHTAKIVGATLPYSYTYTPQNGWKPLNPLSPIAYKANVELETSEQLKPGTTWTYTMKIIDQAGNIREIKNNVSVPPPNDLTLLLSTNAGSAKFLTPATIVEWEYRLGGQELPSYDRITDLSVALNGETTGKGIFNLVNLPSNKSSYPLSSVYPDMPSGYNVLAFTAKDLNGNSGTSQLDAFDFDKVAPTIKNTDNKPAINVGQLIYKSGTTTTRLVTIEAGLLDDYSGVHDVTLSVTAEEPDGTFRYDGTPNYRVISGTISELGTTGYTKPPYDYGAEGKPVDPTVAMSYSANVKLKTCDLLKTGTNWTYTMTIVDQAGNAKEVSNIISVPSPLATFIAAYAVPETILVGETTTLTGREGQNDPMGAILEPARCAWKINTSSKATLSDTTGNSVTLTALRTGEVTATLTYTNTEGQVTTVSKVVTINAVPPKQISKVEVKLTDSNTVPIAKTPFNCSAIAYDNNGLILSGQDFSWNANPSATITTDQNVGSSMVSVNANNTGKYTLSASATGGNGTVKGLLTVEVVSNDIASLGINAPLTPLVVNTVSTFTAYGTTQLNNPVDPSKLVGNLIWKSSVGTIDANGTFTAPTLAQTVEVTVSLKGTPSIYNKVTLPINPGPAVKARSKPAGKLLLVVDDTFIVAAESFDVYNNSCGYKEQNWKANTAGKTLVTPESSFPITPIQVMVLPKNTGPTISGIPNSGKLIPGTKQPIAVDYLGVDSFSTSFIGFTGTGISGTRPNYFVTAPSTQGDYILTAKITTSLGVELVGNANYTVSSAPQIYILADGKEVPKGQKYLSKKARLSIEARDPNLVNEFEVEIFVNNVKKPFSMALDAEAAEVKSTSLNLSSSGIIPAGECDITIKVTARDMAGDLSTESLTFKLSDTAALTGPVFVSPNPSRTGKPNIVFELTAESPVNLYIYDITGRLIWRKAHNGTAGVNTVQWDQNAANGTYLGVLQLGSKTAKFESVIMK